MLGAIVGDIVGSRFESNPHKSKDFELFTDECRFTDDSVMTLAVARAVLEAKSYFPEIDILNVADFQEALADLAEASMQELGRNYPDAGYGEMFRRWIMSDHPYPYQSYGNGGAMRVSPIAYLGYNEWEAVQMAETVTELTHNHEESLRAADAVTVAVAMALRGATRREIKEQMVIQYHPLDFKIDDIREGYTLSVRSSESVPQAIQCFLESTSFEDAIRNAVSLGGDSDTLASIAGAIAGAYYGVPPLIRKKALSYLDETLLAIVKAWEEIFPPKGEAFQVLTKYLGKMDSCEGKAREQMLSDMTEELSHFPEQLRQWLRRLKDLDWQPHHRTFLSLKLKSTLAQEDHEHTRELRFTDQGMTLEKDCYGDKQNPDCQPIHYSLKEAQLFQEHLLALHIEYWSPYYNGRAIDGRTWTLDVYYSDGFRAQYQGVSAYPENWNDLLRLLQVKFNEEDDY